MVGKNSSQPTPTHLAPHHTNISANEMFTQLNRTIEYFNSTILGLHRKITKIGTQNTTIREAYTRSEKPLCTYLTAMSRYAMSQQMEKHTQQQEISRLVTDIISASVPTSPPTVTTYTVDQLKTNDILQSLTDFNFDQSQSLDKHTEENRQCSKVATLAT